MKTSLVPESKRVRYRGIGNKFYEEESEDPGVKRFGGWRELRGGQT